MDYIKLILLILFVAIAINLIVFAVKNIKIPVLKNTKIFNVKYKKTFFYTSLVFFAALGILIINAIVFLKIDIPALVLICLLGVIGVPFLLISLRFVINVKGDYLVYKKRKLYYKDIKSLNEGKYNIVLITEEKQYKFLNNLDYKEEFFFILANKGIPIIRYLKN